MKHLFYPTGQPRATMKEVCRIQEIQKRLDVMEYLKEDGSIDVERIRKLPHDEKCHVIGRFTREQIEEYFSKCPVSHGPIKPVKVNYKMEDLLAKGWMTAEQLLNMIREKCKEDK